MFLRPFNCYQIRPSNPYIMFAPSYGSHMIQLRPQLKQSHISLLGDGWFYPLESSARRPRHRQTRGPRNEGAASVDCLFTLWTETTQANAVEAEKKNTKCDETATLLDLVDDEERTEQISSSAKVAAADSWVRHRGAAFSIQSSASRHCHAARGLTHTK